MRVHRLSLSAVSRGSHPSDQGFARGCPHSPAELRQYLRTDPATGATSVLLKLSVLCGVLMFMVAGAVALAVARQAAAARRRPSTEPTPDLLGLAERIAARADPHPWPATKP
jgi:hypothetical protein